MVLYLMNYFFLLGILMLSKLNKSSEILRLTHQDLAVASQLFTFFSIIPFEGEYHVTILLSVLIKLTHEPFLVWLNESCYLSLELSFLK